MPPLIDLTGRIFGRLTVIGKSAVQDRLRRPKWLCKCECGNSSDVMGEKLRKGRTKSCGCLQREFVRDALNRTTHGHARENATTPEYRAWQSMRVRCGRKSDKGYPTWGGRGIKVCERWQSSFEAFLGDMGLRPSPVHSLDRKDNDGNYEPGNCRWALPEEQCANRRNNRMVTICGETLAFTHAVEKYGTVKPGTAFGRIQDGWDPIAAILTPRRGKPTEAAAAH